MQHPFLGKRQSGLFLDFVIKHCSIIFTHSIKIMGVAERKEREKEELREQILTAAKSLFLKKGLEMTLVNLVK